ncbi:hypothetical protein VNO80_25497 [Phaseolus coccineus]|uniref:Uncharacterized protein n=1 Tax=Phaseolus coccineus TaxID=3886 RepID=A0AAN9QP24_PHACN
MYTQMLCGLIMHNEIVACKAEAYLKLHQLEDDEFSLLNIPNLKFFAEKASTLDYNNVEVGRIVDVVKMVARARSSGNDSLWQVFLSLF